MAEYLRNTAKKVTIQAGVALFLCIATSFAFAEDLPDPTRPPASLSVALDSKLAASTSGPVLQSVLISSGRMAAIISGQTVKLGEKFGEAQLVKITENGVILRNGKDLQTLKLFPGIEKKRTSSTATAKADNRRQ